MSFILLLISIAAVLPPLAQGRGINPSRQPDPSSSAARKDILNTKLRHVHVTSATVPSIVLLLRNHVRFHCGIEDVPCRGVSIADLRKPITLDLHDVTLEQVFNDLTVQNPAFCWKIEKNGLVRFMPASWKHDHSYRLTRRLPQFDADGVDESIAACLMYFALNKPLPHFPNSNSLFAWTQPVATDDQGNPILFHVVRRRITPRCVMDLLAAQVKGSWIVRYDVKNQLFNSAVIQERSSAVGRPDAIVDYPDETPPPYSL